jgi:hypothetical protein
LDCFGDSDGCWQRKQEMYMVSNATNTCWLDAVLLGDAAQIRPQTFPSLRAKNWYTLFGAKYAMDAQQGKSVCHKNMLTHRSKYKQYYLLLL